MINLCVYFNQTQDISEALYELQYLTRHILPQVGLLLPPDDNVGDWYLKIIDRYSIKVLYEFNYFNSSTMLPRRDLSKDMLLPSVAVAAR